MLFRLSIGQFTVVHIFFPFIFGAIMLYNDKHFILKILTSCFIALLIITNILTITISQDAKLVQKDDYSYILTSASWASEYFEDGELIFFPDQLTFGWFIVQSTHMKKNINFRYLPLNDTIALYEGGAIQPGMITVINYRPNYNQIGAWYQARSFKNFEYKINNNRYIGNKIYTYNNDICIMDNSE